jgi:hypothetical protein
MFKHPFTYIIAGPCGSGESSFCITLLQNLDTCKEQKFKVGIIWCYSEKTAVPHKQLSALNKNIHYHKGVSRNNNNFANVQGETCLIILDDLFTEVYSEDVCVLFKSGSHHRNISVILITQNLF